MHAAETATGGRAGESVAIRDEAVPIRGEEVSIRDEEVPFLIGLGGRNVRLIGRFAGSQLRVGAGPDGARTVGIVARGGAAAFDPALARRCVRSVCEGGVLKWFSTAEATRTQYPEEARAGLARMALQEHGCDLLLLRAGTGHMCLLLVARAEDGRGVRAARAAVLGLLAALAASREAAALAAAP